MTYSPDAPSDRTVVEPRDPLLGTVLGGRFRIEQRLAAGGFGAIYRARHVDTHHEYAVKVLHPAHARDPHLVHRFRREGATLASLTNPHTVTTYEVGEDPDGTMYIVMELLRGETLHQRFTREGALPWRDVIAIVRAVCESLIEAHELGIIHRDLKPANIQLVKVDGGEHVKVLDFGIAKLHRGSTIDDGRELTAHGQMIGTFDYMSPEQIVGGTLSGRSDLYTLGVVMYELLTGRRPFGEATGPGLLALVLTDRPAPPSHHVPARFPREIDQVVMRCLEREPQDRYASALELAAVLDLLLGPVLEGPTVKIVRACDDATVVAPRTARGSQQPLLCAWPTLPMPTPQPSPVPSPLPRPSYPVFPAGAYPAVMDQPPVLPRGSGATITRPPSAPRPVYDVLAHDQLVRRIAWAAALFVVLIAILVIATVV